MSWAWGWSITESLEALFPWLRQVCLRFLAMMLANQFNRTLDPFNRASGHFSYSILGSNKHRQAIIVHLCLSSTSTNSYDGKRATNPYLNACSSFFPWISPRPQKAQMSVESVLLKTQKADLIWYNPIGPDWIFTGRTCASSSRLSREKLTCQSSIVFVSTLPKEAGSSPWLGLWECRHFWFLEFRQ